MIDDKIYQNIYDELSKFLLVNWEKLIVYLEYGKASYTFSFYEKIGSEYIKCYDIPNVSEDDLFASFKAIDKLVSIERAKEKGELWSNMTMVVTSLGDMKADFDYTDLSEGTYEFKKEWKKKYLI